MNSFHILSIFPEVFESYFISSILGRAQKNKLISIKTYNLRDWADDKHRKVDDSPYGGGPGMVFKVEPIYKAVQFLKTKIEIENQKLKNKDSKHKKSSTRVILFSTRGKVFDNKEAKRLSKYKNIIFICGRYEGVDERVAKYIADEEISVGNYILSGGEIPAMAVIDSVSRQIKGVLGKNESLEEEKGSYPVFTRPEVYIPDKKKMRTKWVVPKVLIRGNHKEIEEWRNKTKD